MGKYIKYFKTAAEFAEYWDFAELPLGPDESENTLVAYVAENKTVYYWNSDMSEFEVNFSAQSSEIDATAETVSFDVKTGLFWLEVYHNGELIDEYAPGLDKHYDYSVDANMTPLAVTEDFVGKWYRDNNGEKGDYITEFDQPVTHLPDPNADPVRLEFHLGVTSDGQTPTRLGNGSLTGATRVYYEDNGSEIDILNDIYIQSKRAWYQFSAQSEYDVVFEFEGENQTVGDYFIYSQGKSLSIETNYPELAAQTDFRFNGPLMQSTIEQLTLGAGMQSVSGFLMANSLSAITLDDQDRLPEISVLGGVANEGVIWCDENAENFAMWQTAKPAGWYINSTGLGAWFGSSSTFPSSGGFDHIYLSFGLPINDSFELTIESGNAHFNNQSGPTTVTGDTNSLLTGVTFYTEVNTGETYHGSITIVSYDADGGQTDSISLPYTVEGEVVPPAPTGGTVGKVTLVFDIDTSDNPYPIVGGPDVESEFAGEMELYDPNGNRVSSDDFGLYVDKDEHTRLDVQNAVDGAYTLILRRESADLLLQGWLSGGEFRMFTYEEESFDSGVHISLYAGALYDCANLKEVYLGTGFTSVYADSFEDCGSLSLISIDEANEPTIYGGATFVTLSDQSGTLVVPSGADYSNWSAALGQDWTVDDSL